MKNVKKKMGFHKTLAGILRFIDVYHIFKTGKLPSTVCSVKVNISFKS